MTGKLAQDEGKRCRECGGPVLAKGLCRKHYRRARSAALGPCTVEGCPDLQQFNGLCARHNSRKWRLGDVRTDMPDQLRWPAVIERAKAIVEGYDIPVTLRQLHYRLVAGQVIPNTAAAYQRLSVLTAKGRREGTFPRLHEDARAIRLAASWESPDAGLGNLVAGYRRDRTEGQPVTLVLAVEKNALAGLLTDWFGDLGVPLVPLGGYGSTELGFSLLELVERYDRPAVLVYAGDFDATGMDIGRSFVARTEEIGIEWEQADRIALSPGQVTEMDLPVNVGKPADPRTEGFIADHPEIHAEAALGEGVPVQVELDAVEPNTLRGLYAAAIDQFWDDGAYRACLEREEYERAELAALRLAPRYEVP